MPATLTRRPFGVLPDGGSVELYRLEGEGGLVVEAMTYGGIVTRILAPDAAGRRADVALGFDSLEPYLSNSAYLGAIVGRVAGRITGARFALDGRETRLAANNGPNHLHGGLRGFDQRLWAAEPRLPPGGAPSLRLRYHSPDGEEGYPGSVEVTVTYTVRADNAFVIETEATTDQPTPFTLAHHSYFNLAGEASGPATGHNLQVHADATLEADENLAMVGREIPVHGTARDFNRPRLLADTIPGLFLQHGDIYRIRRSGDGLVPAARLSDPASGRVLEVSSTESHMQFYTGFFLDGTKQGKSGVPYVRHSGVCLECQGYPDGANRPDLGDILLRPGAVARNTTVYAFSARPPG